jgi:hypothetical protein
LTLLALGTSTTYVIDEIPGYTLVLDSIGASVQPARKKLRYIAKPDQHPGFFDGFDFISDRINPDIFGMGFDAFFATSTYDAAALDPVEVPEHLVIGKTGTALPGCGHPDQHIRQHTAKLLALTVANRSQGDLSFDFTNKTYDRLKSKVELCFDNDTARVFKEVQEYKDSLLGLMRLTNTSSTLSITPRCSLPRASRHSERLLTNATSSAPAHLT